MASEKRSPTDDTSPALTPLYPSIPPPAPQGAAVPPSSSYPGYSKVPPAEPSPTTPSSPTYSTTDVEAARALPPPTTTITKDKASRRRCANTRSCVCCNCCGVPPRCCRALWCLLLLLFIGLAATAGIIAAKCASAPPVRVDEGKLDLGTFKQGEFKVQSGHTDFGTFNLVTGSPGSEVTWRVEQFSQRSEEKWPKATTSQSESTWTLFPSGSQDHWLNWWGLSLSFGICEASVTTMTVPSDFHARPGGSNYSLTVSMRNSGIKVTAPPLGDAKTGWSSVSLSSTNGGIKVLAPISVQREFSVRTTNGGVHVNAVTVLQEDARVDVTSTNGGVHIDRLELAQRGANVKIESTNGGITLGLKPPAFPEAFSAEVGSSNGGITVNVPRDASLAWKTKTSNGRVMVGGDKTDGSSGILGQGNGNGRQLSMSSTNGGLTLDTNLA